MTNKRVLAIHFKDSLFSAPVCPPLLESEKARIPLLRSTLFALGACALTLISLSLW